MSFRSHLYSTKAKRLNSHFTTMTVSDSTSTLAVAHDDDAVAPVYMSTTTNAYEEMAIEDRGERDQGDDDNYDEDNDPSSKKLARTKTNANSSSWSAAMETSGGVGDVSIQSQEDTEIIPEEEEMEESVNQIENLEETQQQKVEEAPVAPSVVANTVEDYYASLGYEDAAPQLRRSPHYSYSNNPVDPLPPRGVEPGIVQGGEGVRRRSSLLGHIMAWAGAVQQEYWDAAMTTKTSQSDQGEQCQHGQEEDRDGREGMVPAWSFGRRRASMGPTTTTTGTVVPTRRIMPDQELRRYHSTDEGGTMLEAYFAAMDPPMMDETAMEGEGTARYQDHMPGGDGIARPSAPVARRNSLQAVIEQAMAFVNLRQDPNDDDLSPFGTRRDSLF